MHGMTRTCHGFADAQRAWVLKAWGLPVALTACSKTYVLYNHGLHEQIAHLAQ